MNHIKERLAAKAAKNRIPVMGAFELLPVCNLSCKMCYVRKSMAEVKACGGLKDAAWWLDLARQARDGGMLFPLLTGGEPLLHPQFFEILEGMIDMGLQVSVNSNGTLIDETVVEKLKQHRPIRINITLYGASEASYDALCGDGSAFHQVQRAIRLLREAGIPFRLNTSLTPENAHELEAMIAFAKGEGCALQSAYYMFPPIRRDASMVGQNHRLSPEEAAKARVLGDYLQASPEHFLGLAARFQNFVPLEQLHRQPGVEELGVKCRAGVCSFWIDWQGQLSSCGMYGPVVLDLDPPFATQWKSLVEQTEALRYAPACASCPNEPLCHPCLAMVVNECGTGEGTPEYLCRMNQATAQYYAQFAQKHYAHLLTQHPAEADIPDFCGL